ncbi:MAG TPA: glycosyltransferase family 4 protein [Candidatus Paceibacterota bacterium]
MKPRKVLIFSLSYFPKLVGGAEVAVKEITDRISARDAEFDMITIGDGSSPKEEKIGNVRVHRIFSKPGRVQKLFYPFAAYWKARRMTNKTRCDLVWAVMGSYGGFAAFLLKRHNPRLPVLLTIQEGDNFARREGIWSIPFGWIFKNPNRIQAISNYLSDWSRQMGATCPIDVIPNGADLQLFSAEISPNVKEDLIKKCAKKPEDVFLITTSRLVEKNGVADVISALPLLPKNVKFLVLGSGPLEQELKQLALRLGLNYTDEPPLNPGNRVHFLGYIPHSEMPKYLAISEIFIRPSLTEGQGASFIEAMAAGVPLIATAVGGIPDFLTDGQTGLVCEVQNPHSIAQKVEKYMKDKESRDFIIKKARALAQEKYDWNAIAKDMAAEFEKTITN